MKKTLYTALVIACALISPAWGNYAEHPDAVKFSEQMTEKHDFSVAEMNGWLSNAKRVESIISAMERPAEKVKPWYQYKKHFISDLRISRGVEFWLQHKDTLTRAESEFGVDAAMIVSIIGVETNYGRNVGSYRVIDALSTLAFDYYTTVDKRESRRLFFTHQLENLFLLARDQKQDPQSLLGSYAGAMGWGQFMPSSYRDYAVDFDTDGFADIWNNPTDAIGSVANYFAKHGWRSGQAVALRAVLENTANGSRPEGTTHIVAAGDTLYAVANQYGIKVSDLQTTNNLENARQLSVGQELSIHTPLKLNQLRRPSTTLGDLKTQGLRALEPADESRKALPLELDIGGGSEYWLGLNNFYVISRYNPRIKYAMAVYQLSELIRSQYCGPENPC